MALFAIITFLLFCIQLCLEISWMQNGSPLRAESTSKVGALATLQGLFWGENFKQNKVWTLSCSGSNTRKTNTPNTTGQEEQKKHASLSEEVKFCCQTLSDGLDRTRLELI